MLHSRTGLLGLLTVCFLIVGFACSSPHPETACVRLPTVAAATATSARPAQQPSVDGTWLFRCCDETATWVGMLTLVEDNGALRGAWLTDGDSHGSYLEGRREGARVKLWRRWRTGQVLHEQEYDLHLDDAGQHLSGSFREPAFDPTPHSVQMERGFVTEPRIVKAAPVSAPVLVPNSAEPRADGDPKRACDCKLVCYCGGIPPGRQHYEERARCGDSCKCPVCPPLP